MQANLTISTSLSYSSLPAVTVSHCRDNQRQVIYKVLRFLLWQARAFDGGKPVFGDPQMTTCQGTQSNHCEKTPALLPTRQG